MATFDICILIFSGSSMLLGSCMFAFRTIADPYRSEPTTPDIQIWAVD